MASFPLFLLGHDRSGTTMLRLILDRGDVAITRVDVPARRRSPSAGGGRSARGVEPSAGAALGLAGEPPPCRRGLNDADAFRFAVSAPFVAYAEREGTARWG